MQYKWLIHGRISSAGRDDHRLCNQHGQKRLWSISHSTTSALRPQQAYTSWASDDYRFWFIQHIQYVSKCYRRTTKADNTCLVAVSNLYYCQPLLSTSAKRFI